MARMRRTRRDGGGITEEDLERINRDADEAVKALPENRDKDALVNAFAQSKRVTYYYMSYNRALLNRLQTLLIVLAVMVAAIAVGGTIVSVVQVNHNHAQTVAQTRQNKIEAKQAVERAKKTLQNSRLASSYTACIQSNAKNAAAERDKDEFLVQLSDGNAGSIGPFIQRVVTDLAPVNAGGPTPQPIPTHIPRRWIIACRAHAESAVNSPTLKFPSMPSTKP
jgi:hypothetical protein